MNLNFKSPLNLLLLILTLVLFPSCSKDSDLLTDYVLSETKDLVDFENIVVDDTYQVSLSGSIILDVLSNDNFVDESSVVITETSTPANGTVAINDNETLTYTPSAETIAQVSDTTNTSTIDVVDTFTYTTEVVNQDETVSTETGNVTVSIGLENKAANGAKLLFKHGFEGDISIVPNKTYSGYSAIVGTDTKTGYDFETLSLLGGSFYGIHHVINGGDYFENAANSIVTINDEYGSPTQCLKQEIFDWPTERSVTQSTIQINNITTNPTTGLYIKMRMKMEVSDIPDNYDWKVLGGYKTANHDGGGLGVRMAMRYGKAGASQANTGAGVAEGDYYTQFTLDDGSANNTSSNWSYTSSTVLPPDNEWFLSEWYIQWGDGKNGSGGVSWWKINGETVGYNTGALTLNEDIMKYLFLVQMYGGNWDSTGATTNTHTQYIDDVEIWEGLPY